MMKFVINIDQVRIAMNKGKINAVKTKRCGTITDSHLQRAVCTYRSKTEVFVILVLQRKGFIGGDQINQLDLKVMCIR